MVIMVKISVLVSQVAAGRCPRLQWGGGKIEDTARSRWRFCNVDMDPAKGLDVEHFVLRCGAWERQRNEIFCEEIVKKYFKSYQRSFFFQCCNIKLIRP